MTDTDRDRFVELMTAEESPTDACPPLTHFTVENLKYHLGPAAVAALSRFDLEIHTPIDQERLFLALGARLNYWSDDVPHEPLFG